jgi:hypothetical protein
LCHFRMPVVFSFDTRFDTRYNILSKSGRSVHSGSAKTQ